MVSRLPKNEDFRKKWCLWISKVKHIPLAKIFGTISLLVCSVHFEPKYKGNGCRLKPGAVPSLFHKHVIDGTPIDSRYVILIGSFTVWPEIFGTIIDILRDTRFVILVRLFRVRFCVLKFIIKFSDVFDFSEETQNATKETVVLSSAQDKSPQKEQYSSETTISVENKYDNTVLTIMKMLV